MKRIMSWARWPILRGGIVTAFEIASLFYAYYTLARTHRRRP